MQESRYNHDLSNEVHSNVNFVASYRAIYSFSVFADFVGFAIQCVKRADIVIALQRENRVKELLLQAAIRRGFPEFEVELVRLQQGLLGEYYIDRSWKDMHLAEEYYLLHDFYTNVNESSHQIDTLFLCRQFILILEIKNIAGRIDFDEEKHQLIRTREDGSLNGFRNPIDQVKRHQRMLHHFVGNLPVEYAIVFAHPKTIIGRKPSGEAIFHGSGLEFHIRKLLANYEPLISSEKLTNLKNELLDRHMIYEPKINIDRERVLRGVLCQHCDDRVKMQYRYGKFECPRCSWRSNEALLQAMVDYRYLIGEWITNQQFRSFVGVTSTDIAKRLLKGMGFHYEGDRKQRKYQIPAAIDLGSRKTEVADKSSKSASDKPAKAAEKALEAVDKSRNHR